MPTPTETVLEGAVRRALECFGIDADAPDTRVDFIKFRENHVFRVRDTTSDRALRLHRPGYRSDAELLSEVSILAAFGAHGLLVPRPAVTTAGEPIATFVDAEGVRRQATMQDWISDAVPLPDSDAVFDGSAMLEPGVLAQLGALMAELHGLAAGLELPAGYTRAAWDHEGLVGPRALWGTASRLPQLDAGQRAALQAAEARLGAELAALPRDRERFGVIHADLTFENVLSSDDGLVLLDFDDAGEGWYLFDLATAGFWMTGHPRAAELVATMAANYAARRALTAQDEAAWHPLLMARALSYLGWGADRPDDPTTAYLLAVQLPHTVAAARRYAETGSTGWPDLPVAGAR